MTTSGGHADRSADGAEERCRTVAADGEADRPRFSSALLLLALAVFAVPRLAMLTRYPPWQDELWTLDVLARDFPTMLRWIVADQTHPPLFYAMAWVWQRVGGDALWWMRLLPALIGIAAAVPLVALCRAARLGALGTWLAVLLAAASPWLVFYSAELRGTGLYATLAVASLAAWLRARDSATNDRAPWRLLLVVNVAMVYSHYFGWLVVAAEGADALVAARRRLPRFVRIAAWTALAFAPWVVLVVRRAIRFPRGLEMVAWIPRPTLGDFLDPYRAAFGASPWLGVDLALVVLAGGAIAWRLAREGGGREAGGSEHSGRDDAGERGERRAREGPLTPLALAATLPAVIALVASATGPRSMWVARYLLAVAVPFLVLAAAAATGLLAPRLRPAALALALWPAALTAWHGARRDEKVAYDAIVRGMVARDSARDSGRDTTRDVARDAAARATPVVALDYEEGGPLAWVAAHGHVSFAVTTVPSVDSIHSPRAWVVWNAAQPPPGPPPTARLLRRGYRVEDEFFVRGMDDSVVAVAVRRAR